MTYIINPWTFYWIEVAEGMKIIMLAFAITAGVATLAIAAIWYDMGDDDGKVLKKLTKICGVVTIVTLILYIVIPSQKTCMQMLIAKQITIENATWTVDSLKSVVDYIVDAMKELK